MNAQPSAESWGRGEAYEPFIGRWSRGIARQFVAWLDLPAGGRWGDLGCGTGALSGAILATAAPRLVVAIDRSREYVAYAAARHGESPVLFAAADAALAPIGSGAADAVVSGLLLNFLPSPAAGVAEMVRLARPGGTVAAYVWDYAERMELLRHFWTTAVELDPAAAALDEGRRFPLCAPGPLEQLWRDSGLTEIRHGTLEVPTSFAGFDDLWQPFLGGQGPAPSYLAALDQAGREALRQRLRQRLMPSADGPIRLVARAWAVRGRRPT
jgi:SAM-dependent methyltransferase